MVRVINMLLGSEVTPLFMLLFVTAVVVTIATAVNKRFNKAHRALMSSAAVVAAASSLGGVAALGSLINQAQGGHIAKSNIEWDAAVLGACSIGLSVCGIVLLLTGGWALYRCRREWSSVPLPWVGLLAAMLAWFNAYVYHDYAKRLLWYLYQPGGYHSSYLWVVYCVIALALGCLTMFVVATGRYLWQRTHAHAHFD